MTICPVLTYNDYAHDRHCLVLAEEDNEKSQSCN